MTELNRDLSASIVPQRQRIRAQVERLAWLLDNAIPLPFVKYRVGLEPLIGFIPGIGDLAGLLLSSYIVVQAARLGVPWATVLYMVFNAGVEALVGLIPVVGDLFDFAWKANQRNVALMQAALDDPQLTVRRSRRMLTVIFSLAFGALIGLTTVVTVLGVWVWRGVLALVGG